jgi:hypothetical protein
MDASFLNGAAKQTAVDLQAARDKAPFDYHLLKPLAVNLISGAVRFKHVFESIF